MSYKVIVAGSRGFNDYPTMKKQLDFLLQDKMDIEIVSGCAEGSDELGERYAREHELNLSQFPANWNKFGKSAGYIRNSEMADYADACVIFFLNEKTKGSSHMLNLAKEKGLPTRYYIQYTPIMQFRGEHRWLSNMYSVLIEYNGRYFKSVEHAYMSAKSDNPDWIYYCLTEPSPAEVKKKSKTILIKENWEDIKLSVMEELLWKKYNDPVLKELLLNTSKRPIIEGNFWNDLYWGMDLKQAPPVGENHLGKLIMKIRDKLISKSQLRTYKGFITELPENGIFVFGSNHAGRHGLGAAKVAREEFGAIYGQAHGKQGQAYAIITKDLTQKIHPSVSKIDIIKQIKGLYDYAKEHPELDFYVAYSGIGNNLNGYTPKEMAEMFSMENIPTNIIFEEEFLKLMN